MDEESAKPILCRCGAAMQAGYTTARGLWGGDNPLGVPKLVFVVPGEQTLANPIKAVKQGLDEAPTNVAYLLRGYRCPSCGIVELIALDETPWMS
jgi:hypothetical protein